jgi:hypothetical protein
MRVALIVVSMLMVTTPSNASSSCMSKTEARQHFGAVHIYWHGADHCWDATPTRGRQVIQKVARKVERPKWQDSMSEMMLADEPVQTAMQMPWLDRWVDIEPIQLPLVARWVDVAQVAPLPPSEPAPEARGALLVLAFIVFVLTFAVIAILFRVGRGAGKKDQAGGIDGRGGFAPVPQHLRQI